MKKILIIFALAAGLCGCSGWTEPQAKDIHSELSGPSSGYLQDLRAFKERDHKTVIVGMNACADVPTGRFQHPASIPDSVDVIYLRNLKDGLHPSLVSEIASLRADKATKVLADVDFISIADEWDALQEANESNGEPAGTEEEFRTFLENGFRKQLECCERYGLDGIMLSYNGSSSVFSITGRAAFVNTALDWLGKHQDKTVYVRGILSVLSRASGAYDIKGLFDRCSGMLYACGTEESTGNVEMAIERIIDRGEGNVPRDRFVREVTVPTPADPAQIGLTPSEAASWTTVAYQSFDKTGICIENAQDDYFMAEKSYGSIREAIRILNL